MRASGTANHGESDVNPSGSRKRGGGERLQKLISKLRHNEYSGNKLPDIKTEKILSHARL